MTSLLLPDVTKPPPSVIVGHGTLLYPNDSVNLNNSILAVDQLADESIKWANEEIALWKASRHKDSLALRSSHGSKRNYCYICSEFNRPATGMKLTFHRHTSSKNERLTAENDYYGQYHCTTCKITPHRFKMGERTPLLLTTSTLNKWRPESYEGDEIHLDEIGIPGGRIKDLEHAYLSEYGRHN